MLNHEVRVERIRARPALAAAAWALAALRLPALLWLAGWLAPAPAFAKPMVVEIEQVLDQAWMVAEVHVRTVAVAGWDGIGPEPGRVLVQVTSDPRRIYKGLAQLGRTLELRPSPAGPQKCTADLNPLAGSGKPVLLVVDNNRAIRLQGIPGPGATRYRMRGWYDRNAYLLTSRSGRLGEQIRDRSGYRGLDVSRQDLADRWRGRNRAFCGLVARFLAREPPLLDDAELAGNLRALGAPDAGRRARAAERLRRRALLNIPALRAAAGSAADPEVRRSLRRILAELRDCAEAYKVAKRLATAPATARIHVVREGLYTLRGAALYRAAEYLARMRKDG